MNKRVLILGARSPVALEWARSLNANGYEVFMADSLRFPISRWSNSITKYIQIPSPVYSFDEFKKIIISLIRIHEISDCLPINEETFYISKIKDLLPCKVWTSEFDLLDSLHRKDSFIQLAQRYFSVPCTTTELTESIFERSETLVFKAIYSRFATQVYIKVKPNELTEVKNDSKNWLAQEYIEGTEYCVYGFYDEGELKCISVYQPLIRAGKGAGIYLKEISIPKLEDRVNLFAKSINFTGQLSFDVIQKEDDFYIIECNPRATSGAHFIGQDLYKSFGESRTNSRRKSKDLSLKIILLSKNPFAFFGRKWRNSSDFIWDKSDVKPSLFQFLAVVEMLYVALVKHISPLEATSNDIAWNGDE